jgi:hypothetical protein
MPSSIIYPFFYVAKVQYVSGVSGFADIAAIQKYTTMKSLFNSAILHTGKRGDIRQASTQHSQINPMQHAGFIIYTIRPRPLA